MRTSIAVSEGNHYGEVITDLKTTDEMILQMYSRAKAILNEKIQQENEAKKNLMKELA